MIHLAFALVFLGAVSQGAEPERESVELPTNWSVGDRLTIDWVKTRAEFEDGQRTRQTGLRSNIRLEVLASSDEGFVFRWDVDQITSDGILWDSDRAAQDLLERTADLSLEIVTDEFGMPTTLRNRDAVRQRYERSIEAARNLRAASGEPVPAEVERMLVSQLTDPNLTALALGDIRTLFMLAGGRFELGQRTSRESQLPNPLGGPPLPAPAIVVPRTITAQNVVVQWRQAVDPVLGQEALLETFAALAKERGASPPTLDELPALDVVDEAQYVFDRATGWPTELTWERRVIAGPRASIHTLRFELERAAPAETPPK